MPKRTASDSSVLSDQHQKMDNLPKKKVIPLIKSDELPEDMPTWASIFVNKFNELNESVQHIGFNVDKVLNEHSEIKKKVENLDIKQSALESDTNKISEELVRLKTKQLEMEVEMKKSNIIINGIDESHGENLLIKVQSELNKLPNIKKDIAFRKCTRLGREVERRVPGRSRTILATLENADDKYAIYAKKKHLPSKISIKDDLPMEVSESRKELMPIFRYAKANEAFAKSTKFRGDALQIGRVLYSKSLGNLHQIPPALSLENTCCKSNETVTAFFGKHCPLSNFYPCSITINGHKYPSSEHFLQEQKAIEFNCHSLAKKIREASTPAQAKSLSYEISGYDNTHWSSIASEYLATALRNKFAQNDYCRQYLLQTGTKSLGEATKDRLFGTGIMLSSDNCLNSHVWEGKNIMGRTLEMIREELKSP